MQRLFCFQGLSAWQSNWHLCTSATRKVWNWEHTRTWDLDMHQLLGCNRATKTDTKPSLVVFPGGGPVTFSSEWHHPDVCSSSSSLALCSTSFWRVGKCLGGQDSARSLAQSSGQGQCSVRLNLSGCVLALVKLRQRQVWTVGDSAVVSKEMWTQFCA